MVPLSTGVAELVGAGGGGEGGDLPSTRPLQSAPR